MKKPRGTHVIHQINASLRLCYKNKKTREQASERLQKTAKLRKYVRYIYL